MHMFSMLLLIGTFVAGRFAAANKGFDNVPKELGFITENFVSHSSSSLTGVVPTELSAMTISPPG